MVDTQEAIGVFDSGVGGLTVLRQIAQRLPNESLLYLGDTARVPYGTKSPQTVIRYARACANILLQRGIKLLVVACNTASAFATNALRDELSIPVIDVIEPGARAATQKTANQRIGVIGTAGTVASRAYPNAIARLLPDASVVCKPCPLFVPLAEEGWTDGEVPFAVAKTYLQELLDTHIDTLVLGCTHYPLLKNVIAQSAGSSVVLVDSAEETAGAVETTLRDLKLNAPHNTAPYRHFLVSDAPEGFTRIAQRFFGGDIDQVEWVDF
ncbi:MAG TPA: glutamate racemase [Candidatus Hydrogenedentes bacterium]|nr:glutamate racemase [Candidatus Hydrogenedentota bacterium]